MLLNETRCLASFALNQVHGFMPFQSQYCFWPYIKSLYSLCSGCKMDLTPCLFYIFLPHLMDFIILYVEKLMLYHITTWANTMLHLSIDMHGYYRLHCWPLKKFSFNYALLLICKTWFCFFLHVCSNSVNIEHGSYVCHFTRLSVHPVTMWAFFLPQMLADLCPDTCKGRHC